MYILVTKLRCWLDHRPRVRANEYGLRAITSAQLLVMDFFVKLRGAWHENLQLARDFCNIFGTNANCPLTTSDHDEKEIDILRAQYNLQVPIHVRDNYIGIAPYDSSVESGNKTWKKRKTQNWFLKWLSKTKSGRNSAWSFETAIPDMFAIAILFCVRYSR